MEQVRDLNMKADDMQVVLSAISSVSRRIKEVAQTHKPLFGDEHFLTGKEVCERLYTSPRPCRTIGTGGLSLTRSLQGRYFIRLRIWKGCWRITIRSSNANMLSSEYVIKSKIINNVIDYYTFV